LSTSTYLQNALLNGTLVNSAYSPPTTVYVGLHTSNPTASTSVALSTEVSGNGYSRVSSSWGTPSAGSMSINTTITFPQASPAGWGTISYISLWDASTLGNLLYFGSLNSSITVNATDEVKILSGNLTVTIT
jgi:hypothetical protein